jgi:hypothetical protein
MILKDPPEGGFERRIGVGEITGKCREKLVCLVFGTLLPNEGEVRSDTLVLEMTCDFMCYRGLSGACLAKEHEASFRFGILDPLEDMIQEIFACSRKTPFLIAESPASLIRQFPDYVTEFCVLSVRSRSRGHQYYAPASNAWFDIALSYIRTIESSNSCLFGIILLTSSCIRSTVTSVVTAARARKSSRSRVRMVRYCVTFPSTLPRIFFQVRFPANPMLTITNQNAQDNVPTRTSFAYDSINLLISETRSNMSSRIFA